jgi:dCMP deaminase
MMTEDPFRASWDDVWVRVAIDIGMRSRCVRAQVGAVVVTADNRVAATGYNGPAAGRKVTGGCDGWCPRAMGRDDLGSDYSACESIHAETNALLRANFTEIAGGTIYVSHASCINCSRLVANSGLVRLVHRVTKHDAHREPDKVEHYLREVGIEVARA